MLSEFNSGYSRALLFDWDGTLVDSQPANYRALADALALFGITLDRGWFAARTGISARDMIRMLVEQRDDLQHSSVADIIAAREARVLELIHKIQTNREIEAIVMEFYGKLPMAIASGGSSRIINAILELLPIRNMFDAVITRDDVTRGKPCPDIFLEAASVLGVDPEECLVFEDSDEGIAAARAAAMPYVDVRPYLTAQGNLLSSLRTTVMAAQFSQYP